MVPIQFDTYGDESDPTAVQLYVSEW
jgi:hypothetical protein